MLAQKLLELTTEYANAGNDDATLGTFGMEPERSRETIAEEYGEVLREFLTAGPGK